ncbi:hypothetical protein, partial [Mesorhizobium sp.]|uniref:hypothetical protein n=1 Tax=Mesorhizobium sp. TaxID=1871066 RepID=UPI00258091BA
RWIDPHSSGSRLAFGTLGDNDPTVSRLKREVVSRRSQYSAYVDAAERLRLTRRHVDAQASRSGCRIGGEDDTATGAPISAR